MFARTSNVQDEPKFLGSLLEGLFTTVKAAAALNGGRPKYSFEESLSPFLDSIRQGRLPPSIIGSFNVPIFKKSAEMAKNHAEQRKKFGDPCHLSVDEIAAVALYSSEMAGMLFAAKSS